MTAEQRAKEINRNPKSKWNAVDDGGGGFKLVPRKRSFQAASVNRLTSDWITRQTSPDTQLRYQLRTLISRSRDMENNNEYWEGFLKQVERNVVGPDGIKLRMKIYEPDTKGGRKTDTVAGEIIEQAWKEFNKPKNFTINKRLSGPDACRLWIRAIARDGATLVRIIRGRNAGNRFGITFQPLEIDHLDTDLNGKAPNGNKISMGVEQDAFGTPIAYHLLTDHPGEDYWTTGGRKYIRVDATDVIHPYNQTRAGQSRGFPWCASILYGLKMLGGYREAELIAARNGASQGGFLRDPNGEGLSYDNPDQDSCDPQNIMPVEPGMAPQWIGGMEFVQYDPTHPNQAYPDFQNEILRGTAAALGSAHHNLSGNMAGVNYSSARIAELSERDQWKLLQRWFIDSLLEPIFDEWLFASLLAGAIKFPNGNALPVGKYDKFNQPTWLGRRWAWVDPKKESESQINLLRERLTSRGRILAENGLDEEDIYEEIAYSESLLEEKGIRPLPQFQQQNQFNQQQQVDNEENENDDD